MSTLVRLVQILLSLLFVLAVINAASRQGTTVDHSGDFQVGYILGATLVGFLVLGVLWILPASWRARRLEKGRRPSQTMLGINVLLGAFVLSLAALVIQNHTGQASGWSKSGLAPPFTTQQLLAHVETTLVPPDTAPLVTLTSNPWDPAHSTPPDARTQLLTSIMTRAYGNMQYAIALRGWAGTSAPLAARQWYDQWLLGHGWCRVAQGTNPNGSVFQSYKEDSGTLFTVATFDPAQFSAQQDAGLPAGSTVYGLSALIVLGQAADTEQCQAGSL